MESLPAQVHRKIVRHLPLLDVFALRRVSRQFNDVALSSLDVVHLVEKDLRRQIQTRQLATTFDKIVKGVLTVHGRRLRTLRMTCVELVVPECNFGLICDYGTNLTRLSIPIIFDNTWLNNLGRKLRNLRCLSLIGDFPIEYLPKFPNLIRLESTLTGPLSSSPSLESNKAIGEKMKLENSKSGGAGDGSSQNLDRLLDLIKVRLVNLKEVSVFEPEPNLLAVLFKKGDYAIPAVKELSFCNSNITDDASKLAKSVEFCRNFPGAESLRFKGVTINNWNFLNFVPTFLQKLELAFCNLELHFSDYSKLQRLSELQELVITGPSLANFAFLSAYQNLRSIKVLTCKHFTVASFANIPPAAKLERVFLRGVPAISNELVSLLVEREYKLKELAIYRSRDYFGDVDDSAGRQPLDLNQIYTQIARSPHLESLDLSGHGSVDDEIFDHLAGRLDYTLTNLALENTSITKIGVKRFLEGRRDKIKAPQGLSLPLMWFYISGEARCPGCEELGEEGNVEVTTAYEDDGYDDFDEDDDDDDDGDSPDDYGGYSDPEYFEGMDMSDIDD